MRRPESQIREDVVEAAGKGVRQTYWLTRLLQKPHEPISGSEADDAEVQDNPVHPDRCRSEEDGRQLRASPGQKDPASGSMEQ
jgi:hypothetical protein